LTLLQALEQHVQRSLALCRKIGHVHHGRWGGEERDNPTVAFLGQELEAIAGSGSRPRPEEW
jgi:hypothetical protein